MRTVERFAFFFGIANLVLGILSMFSPFVADRRRGFLGIFPRRRQGIFNTRPGMLLGGLGATNPMMAGVHSALGAAGLATRPLNGFSRAYMWISGLLFAAMAVMGWMKVGFRPGIHNVMGLAIDWRDNILHTLFGVGSLLLAIKPDLGQTNPIDSGLEMAQVGLTE